MSDPNFTVLSTRSQVLGSDKWLQHKDFTTLSVTADKWVPLQVVPPDGLIAWLQSKRREGFQVVGAEQTSSSVGLETFRFPAKTVMVLGAEQTGIPAEIIQEIDVCVEIPQFGQIRSLNVHVSGALFIWEYVRQQMFCKDAST